MRNLVRGRSRAAALMGAIALFTAVITPPAIAQTTSDAIPDVQVNETGEFVEVFSEDNSMSQDNAALVDDYLQQQARSGRAVDAASVHIETTEGDAAAGRMTAVLEQGDSLESLTVMTASAEGDNGAEGLLFEFASAPQDDFSDEGTPGAGYEAGSSPSGFRLPSGNFACRNLFYDAPYPSVNNSDHYIYDCWEKWDGSGTDWIYNRYTAFDAADGLGTWRGRIIDATLRTRPWSSTRSRVTGGPYNYAPQPSSTCVSAAITIPGSVGFVTFPDISCSARLTSLHDGRSGYHYMGVDWNGNTTAQVYLDSVARFRASSSSTVPSFADYVWMEVEYSANDGGSGCVFACPSQVLNWRDSGFDR